MTPKVAVAAVVGNERGEMLLTQRADSGVWLYPVGWADVGYSPSEVAVKEVYEETGIEVEPVSLIAVFDGLRLGFARLPLYSLVFHCRVLGGELKGHPLETRQVGFYARDALPQPLAGGDRWVDLAFAAIDGEERPLTSTSPAHRRGGARDPAEGRRLRSCSRVRFSAGAERGTSRHRPGRTDTRRSPGDRSGRGPPQMTQRGGRGRGGRGRGGGEGGEEGGGGGERGGTGGELLEEQRHQGDAAVGEVPRLAERGVVDQALGVGGQAERRLHRLAQRGRGDLVAVGRVGLQPVPQLVERPGLARLAEHERVRGRPGDELGHDLVPQLVRRQAGGQPVRGGRVEAPLEHHRTGDSHTCEPFT